MQLREEFVLQAIEPGAKMAPLCRRYGISRKTGYKWLERYRSGGVAALEAMSRRPQRSPLATTAEVAADIIALRIGHPSWGPRKLVAVLARESKHEELPSVRTAARILERAGLIERARRRRHRRLVTSTEAPKIDVRRPNDLWTVDFKGWWKTRDGKRCEPLTIRDAYSRYVLAIVVTTQGTEKLVHRVFEGLFRRWGRPAGILSDNGTPFVSPMNPVGLTKLGVWWQSLGIEHYRSRVSSPQDNGAHERLHADMLRELEVRPAATLKAQQAECDRWRHEFNHHRPHEALGMKTPSEVYRASAIRHGRARPEYGYDVRMLERSINRRGCVKLDGRLVFVSEALAGQRVALEPVEGGLRLWFRERCLGTIADATNARRRHFVWNEQRKRA